MANSELPLVDGADDFSLGMNGYTAASKLDPRQYDPRRIVREALLEEKKRPANAAEKLNRPKPIKPLELGEAPPFDPEAT